MHKNTHISTLYYSYFSFAIFFHFRFTTPNFKRTQETSNESTKTIFCCRISEIKIGALLFRSHRKINHHRSTFLFSARSSALSHTLPRSTIPHLPLLLYSSPFRSLTHSPALFSIHLVFHGFSMPIAYIPNRWKFVSVWFSCVCTQ